MKASIIVLFLLPSILLGQTTFQKINDSTVYKYQEIVKTIYTNTPIPLAVDGYSNPRLGATDGVWGNIIYQKIIDSFHLVGGKCAASKYAFEAAYNQPDQLITTSQWNVSQSFSNFFFKKIYEIKGEKLLFNSQTKNFILTDFTGTAEEIPYFRWIAAIVIFGICCFAMVNIPFNFQSSDKQKAIGQIIGISLAVLVFSGGGFWMSFSIFNAPRLVISQMIIIWSIQLAVPMLYGFIYWKIVNNKEKQKTQLA